MVLKMDLIRTPKVDNVKLIHHCSTNKVKGLRGTLHLTTTHLIFVNGNEGKETWILYGHICETEKLPLSARGSSIRLKTTTFLNVTLIITRERECNDVFDTIAQLSNPVRYEDMYAFHFSPKAEDLTQRDGWYSYDASAEFTRQEVPKELWTLTDLNIDYRLCSTYPCMLYLPASVTAETIKECAKFRSKNRLPVLSYYHKSSGVSICRCAQPLAGMNKRCTEDEMMIQSMIRSTPGTTRMYIVDTRPKINAMANRAAGKGYENVAHYDNVDFQFIGIENIHVMRTSLQKILEVFETSASTVSTYLQAVEDSGWLKHVKSVLDTSAFIAKAISYEKRTVLVHCSDGWDRTAQTCSLAGLLLDPFYRTVHGFQMLIEKEWLSFGHKFTDRCGMLSGTGDPKEVSPIFTQFLECVWQLMVQYPTAFQFNEQYLLEIHYHLYSHQFGTFIGNSEKERLLLKLADRTYSLWGSILQNLKDYINPFYTTMHGVLTPLTPLKHLNVWHGLYNRHTPEIHPREIVTNFVSSLNDNNTALRCHIRYLEERTQNLKGFMAQPNANGECNDSVLCNEDESNDVASKRNSNGEISDIVEEIDALDMCDDLSGGSPLKVVRGTDVVAPVKTSGNTSDSFEQLNCVTELIEDIPDFAVNWETLLSTMKCSCGKHIDGLNRIPHCWNCGCRSCGLCASRSLRIPALHSEEKFPVCRMCFKQLSSGN